MWFNIEIVTSYLVDRKNPCSNRFSKNALPLTRNSVVSTWATLTSWILLIYIFVIVSSCLWRVWYMVYELCTCRRVLSYDSSKEEEGKECSSLSLFTLLLWDSLYLNLELGPPPAISHEASLPHSAMRWLQTCTRLLKWMLESMSRFSGLTREGMSSPSEFQAFLHLLVLLFSTSVFLCLSFIGLSQYS